MKYLRRFFVFILTTVIVLIGLAYLFQVDYLLKAVRTIYFKGHTTAFLEDYKAFDNTTVQAGTAVPWPLHTNYNQRDSSDRLLQTHKETGTIAYLVIQNDSILHEAYYDGFGENSKSNSFSMAKSFVSGLLGKAIMDGYIDSLEQPVRAFFPNYEGSEATVGDLASMASGMDWDESYYSPFSVTTKAYFYDNLEELMLEQTLSDPPGEGYRYLSGNTQLLAMILEKASGKKLADYFSESFWQPLGATEDALWQLDSKDHGMVKAYCCFASNARDFARFGKLYKDHGRFNSQQLLDSAFVAKSIQPRFEGAPYGYGFWLGDFQGKDFFAMRGHLGQYVITIPEDDLIVVRLGHSKGKGGGPNTYPDAFWVYLEEAYALMD